MNIQEKLFELKDDEYGDFQTKLTPTITRESCIGVRIPVLRALAKEIKNTNEAKTFIQDLPHKYYDENILHAILLSFEKEYDEAVEKVDKFLPYVDNWAVCDTLKPKAFKKDKERLIAQIRHWAASPETYTCRFGVEMLMTHFLDEDFKEEYLEIPAEIHSDEYYVKMMNAWFYATALAKQWDATIPYVESNRLDTWVHNKTIQKARESFRISPEQKEYLKELRRK